jgi:N utilization substance protein B
VTTTAPKKFSHTVSARSAARLGAVQALYQLAVSDAAAPESVVQEFLDHRLGHEIEGAQYANADNDFFRDLVTGTYAERDTLDKHITTALAADWPIHRLETIVHAILRAGVYELLRRLDVPTKVILNEYVEVAKAFYDDDAPGFINGVLNKLAQDIRAGA